MIQTERHPLNWATVEAVRSFVGGSIWGQFWPKKRKRGTCLSLPPHMWNLKVTYLAAEEYSKAITRYPIPQRSSGGVDSGSGGSGFCGRADG
jgi:hypothetical protein